MDIAVYENENAFLDFTLKYGNDWSVAASRGNYVAQSAVSAIYFYVSATESGTAFITATLANSKIVWLSSSSTVDGKIRVKLSTDTASHVGQNQAWELRIKFTDGSYVSAEAGKFHILQSIVDRP